MKRRQIIHITQGELRAFLDHQLDPVEQGQIKDHMATCPTCQHMKEALMAQSTNVNYSLNALSPRTSEAPPPSSHVLKLLEGRKSAYQEKPNMSKRIFARGYRPAWVALLVIAVLASLLAFPSVRAIANNFLGLFRVEQIAVVPINPDNLSPEIFNEQTRIEQIIAEDAKQEILGQYQEAANLDEASALAGIPLRIPGELGEPVNLSVSPPERFTYTVDLNKIRLLLDAIGEDSISLPDGLDGQTITADVPSMVNASFGDCSSNTPQTGASGSDPDEDNAHWNTTCFNLAQMASPTVTAPPGLDVTQIVKTFLRVAGLSEKEIEAYTSTVDWSTTLLFPVPTYTDYVEVNVDGVKGILVIEPSQYRYLEYPRFVLIWVKDGILYALSGSGTTGRAISIANSMK